MEQKNQDAQKERELEKIKFQQELQQK